MFYLFAIRLGEGGFNFRVWFFLGGVGRFFLDIFLGVFLVFLDVYLLRDVVVGFCLRGVGSWDVLGARCRRSRASSRVRR